ncbi:MAG TPA: toxin-antitoxin system HicB family antitoxin [Pyrinomonadaceae bacterium]|nr:toxin-antitoxin system HicB family antitoxin [Pyrinomonadaceae bacterium]
MKEKKPKVGRPPLPKGEARGIMTQFRLQPDEKKRLEAAAKKQGLTLSDWIRQTLKAAATQ